MDKLKYFIYILPFPFILLYFFLKTPYFKSLFYVLFKLKIRNKDWEQNRLKQGLSNIILNIKDEQYIIDVFKTYNAYNIHLFNVKYGLRLKGFKFVSFTTFLNNNLSANTITKLPSEIQTLINA